MESRTAIFILFSLESEKKIFFKNNMTSQNSILKMNAWSNREPEYSFLRLMSLILSNTDFIVFSTIFRCPILNESSRMAVDETYIVEFTHLPPRVVHLSLSNLKKSNFIHFRRTNNGNVYFMHENEIVSKLRAFCRRQHEYNTNHSDNGDLTCSCGQTFDIFNHTDIDMKCKSCDKIYNEENDPKLNIVKDIRNLSQEAFSSHGPFLKYESGDHIALKWPQNTPIAFDRHSSSSKRSREETSDSNLNESKTKKPNHAESFNDTNSSELEKQNESSMDKEFDGLITQEELESMSEHDVNEYMYKLMNA